MKVLVECYPDWEVLHFLGIPRKQLLHEPSKGRIVTRLKDLPGATGMVDEDPTSARPRDLDSYQESSGAEGLRLLTRRGSGGQRLIVLCPRLEEWLMQRAKSSGIKPDDYGLPRDPDHLHSIPHYEQKDGFHQFLAELSNLDKGMGLLRRWVVGRENP
jgi:hypothetical protein